MLLYHGSTVEIKQIDLALSKPNKDFGREFYLFPGIQRNGLSLSLRIVIRKIKIFLTVTIL